MKTKAKKAGKAEAAAKYKKAPDAPKRFKSAFIIFSALKHKEINKNLLDDGRTVKTTDIAKLVSESWKGLDPEERKEWERSADKDKARYEAEKSMYKGPWKILSNKRKLKDPAAPKRPMSAFLAYSNSRRAALKREHPKSTNADLSRMLSKTWKALDPQERAVYMAEERQLREQYKTEISDWRKKSAEQQSAEREDRESTAMLSQAPEAGAGQAVKPDPANQSQGGAMDNKGMAMQNQQGDRHQQEYHQQQQQQQLNEIANAGKLSSPYLQAAAFGRGQGNDARASLGLNPSAASSNPYFANSFTGQTYMQAMPGMQGGNPAFPLFGVQTYMQNGGMPGQRPQGFLGGNFGGMAGMNGNDSNAAAGVYGSYGQFPP